MSMPNITIGMFSTSRSVAKKHWSLHDCLGLLATVSPPLLQRRICTCVRLASRVQCPFLLSKLCLDCTGNNYRPPFFYQQEVAGAQRIYQLLQYKADVSLVKANIAALEEREHTAERHRREAEQARALRELAELKAEELRLREAVDALEAKRIAYARAAKVQ